MVKENRPINILLIEDNPGDVRLTQEAFKEGKVSTNLEIVMDGVSTRPGMVKLNGILIAASQDKLSEAQNGLSELELISNSILSSGRVEY